MIKKSYKNFVIFFKKTIFLQIALFFIPLFYTHAGSDNYTGAADTLLEISHTQGRRGAGLSSIVEISMYFLQRAAELVVGLATVAFIWGLIKYVISESDQDKKNAKNIIFYGIVILFVMVSVWSLVGIFENTFRIGGVKVDYSPTGETINIFK